MPVTTFGRFRCNVVGSADRSRYHSLAIAQARPKRGGKQLHSKVVCQNDGDSAEVLGDWRDFRAKLVASSGSSMYGSWEARTSAENMDLLRQQNSHLGQEGVWAHATGIPERGGLLLASPFASQLKQDYSYWQLVVVLLQHDEQGSMGVILNRPTSRYIGEKSSSSQGDPLGYGRYFADNRMYLGGFEVQEAVHLLHGHGSLTGALEIVPGIYVGGQRAAVQEVADGALLADEFRFFSGVLAWRPGQLKQEIENGVWYTAACSRSLVLKQCLSLPTPLWREIMDLMGDEYAEMARLSQEST